MEFMKGKYIIILILILTVCLLGLTIIGGGFGLNYYILYDNYFWLIENPLDEFFMTMMGLLLSLSLLSNVHSLYVSDSLAIYFNKLTSGNGPQEEEGHRSTLVVKIGKGLLLLICAVTFTLALYDYVTINPLFHSRGILKSLQKYKTDMRIKVAIDKLQLNYDCCGHLSYSNWTDWNVMMELGPYDGQDEILRYIPFSCCDSKSMRPCLLELVEMDHGPIGYEFPKDLTINQRGCSIVMKDVFKNTILPLIFTFGGIFLLESLTLVAFLLV